jgi:hypothetical protein
VKFLLDMPDERNDAVNATALVDRYFELWKTTDDDERHALAQKVFAESAVHYAAPAKVSFSGVEEIVANIAQVNKENIQEAGLQFRPGAIVPNHDSVHVQWEVVGPDGSTVGGGRDFLLLDDDGLSKSLCMFAGQ